LLNALTTPIYEFFENVLLCLLRLNEKFAVFAFLLFCYLNQACWFGKLILFFRKKKQKNVGGTIEGLARFLRRKRGVLRAIPLGPWVWREIKVGLCNNTKEVYITYTKPHGWIVYSSI